MVTDNQRSERINISDTVMEIYVALTSDGQNVEQSPFKTYKDVFMCSACIGFLNEKRSELPSGKKTQIRQEVFTERDLSILKALAIANTGSVAVLENLEFLTIAEEYAHAGILNLRGYLLNQTGLPLWNLVEIFQASKERGESE